MRLSIALGLIVVILLGLGPAATYGAITTPYLPTASTALAPGVRHENGTLVAHSRTHYVNVVSVDLGRDGLDVRLAQANGVATNVAFVTDQAADYNTPDRQVVATINGSTFFYLSTPDGVPIGGTGQGLNVSDGELINAGAPIAADQLLAFGVDANDVPIIGIPTFDMQLTLPGDVQHALHRINQRRNDSEAVLYTPRYDSRTWTNDLGVEYVIEGFDLPLTTSGTHGGTIVAVNSDTGNTPIGPGQVVLSVAVGAAAPFASLAIGDEVALELSIDSDWSSVVNSVGGRNPLLTDGQDVTTNRKGYHPRSAVGIRADGSVVLLTADDGDVDEGGMTLHEMASLMLSLGAVDAVNLDGGQSTQLAVRQPGRDEVSLVSGLQTPPDTLRPVVNALQVVTGPAADDSEPPAVTAPVLSIGTSGKAGKQSAAIGVAWSATDDATVTDTDVEMQIGAGGWSSVSVGSPTASAASIVVPYGAAFSVRVRATDQWGNVSPWAVSDRRRLALYDDGNAAVSRGGGWTRKSSSKAIGGAFRQSAATSAWMELAYQGVQVAWIGQVGPRKGLAQVGLDSGPPAAVSTTASTADVRRILFVSPLASASGPSLIRVMNAGSSATPLLDIDAFLVLRPAQ